MTCFARLIAVGIALAGKPAGAAVVTSMDDVQFWVGSGVNSAVMVIDWQDGKNLPGETIGQALAWGYRWESGQTRTGMDMVAAISAADPRLDVKFDFRTLGQIVFGIYQDLDADGGSYFFDTLGESGGASDVHDHFREGWRINGFWGYRVGATNGSSLPSWNVSGGGAAGRTLANGAWDAWVFSEDFVNFSIPVPVSAAAAVPEPGSLLLVLWGAAILWRRR